MAFARRRRVILICAGVSEKNGGATDRDEPGGRLRLLDANASTYRDIVPRLVDAAPDAFLVPVTARRTRWPT